jgi:hypothetical protein
MKRVFALATVVLLGLCLTAPVQATPIPCLRCSSTATLAWYFHTNDNHAFPVTWSTACVSASGDLPPAPGQCPQCGTQFVPADSATCNTCPSSYPAFWYA